MPKKPAPAGPRSPDTSRIVLLTGAPTVCQLDSFEALARLPGVSVSVIRRSAAALDSDPKATVDDASRVTTVRRNLCLPGLGRVLSKQLPRDAAILHGPCSSPAVHAARRFLVRRGIPWYYWAESPQRKPTAGLVQNLSNRILRRFVGSAAGVLGVGTLACEAWRKLLADETRIHNLPYAPHLDPLLAPDQPTQHQAHELRAAWGVSQPVVVLFASPVTQHHGSDLLFGAFASIAAETPNLCLLYVGQGSQVAPLRSRARQSGLEGRIRFVTTACPAREHAAFLSADVFALPTRAYLPWGIPVHLALAAGLPALVSDRVGCRDDLIQEGKTGHVLPGIQTDGLAAALKDLALDADRRQRMADRARAVAKQTGSKATAAALLEFLKK